MAIKINNLGKFCMLMLLVKGSVYGYELLKRVRETAGRSSPGQVYPFLKLLEKNKLVTARRAGGREKTTYSLTPAGRKFAAGLVGRMGEVLDAALKSKLCTCAHCGCEVYKGTVRRKVKGLERCFCCEACADSSTA